MDNKQTGSSLIKHRWLPSPGNIIFSLLLVSLLILTQRVWATPTQNTDAPSPSATTINYQGNLTDANGNPKNGSFDMSFSLWDAASGGAKKWGTENHAGVPVSNGIFNVGLGSKTSSGIPTTTWNGDRYLEITVGDETLTPRELIRSVPIAGMALTVPNNSITDEKLDLKKGSSCLSSSNNVELTTTNIDIPGLALEFTLDQPGTVLIAFDGIAHFNSGTNAVFYLKATSTNGSATGAGQFLYNTNYWSTLTGDKFITLDEGTYTLAARAYSESSANVKLYGGGQEALKTCISYVVLGQ